MAFNASQEQAQDDELKDQANQSGSAPPGAPSGGGGFAGQGGQGQSGGPAGQRPSASGNWTNLNTYLSANADQAPAVGQALAQNVGGQAQQAQNNLSSVVSGFQGQKPFADLNQTSSEQVGQAFADPSQYAPQAAGGVASTPDTSAPSRYLNNDWGLNSQNMDITGYGSSGGPSWASTDQDFNRAEQALANTQSESGRGALLQDQYSGKGVGYNQGQQRFDQLLLQQNPENQSTLNQLYSQYQPQIATAQQTALTGAQEYAKAQQAKAKGFQDQAVGALNQEIADLGQSVSGAVAAKSAQYPKAYQDLLASIQNQQVTGDQAALMGVDMNAATYNMTPEQIASFLRSDSNPYAGDQAANYAASSQDWKNFAGLQALLSGANNNASQLSALQSVGLKGTQADQAKAPAVKPVEFDTGGFQQARNVAETSYQNALNDPRGFLVRGEFNPSNNSGGWSSPAQYASYAQLPKMIQDILAANPGQTPTLDPKNGNPLAYQWTNALNAFNQKWGVGNTLSKKLPAPTKVESVAPTPQPHTSTGDAPVGGPNLPAQEQQASAPPPNSSLSPLQWQRLQETLGYQGGGSPGQPIRVR